MSELPSAGRGSAEPAPGYPGGSGLEVDGVRALVLQDAPADDADGPGQVGAGGGGTRARLLFRVGAVDEGLPDSGVTLVALRTAVLGLPPGVEVTVELEPTTSSVVLTGGPDAVAAGLHHISRRLADLPTPQVDAVRQRLVAEQDADLLTRPRLPSCATPHFGARGFGVLGFRSLGLASLTPDAVARWARTRLVTGAAVLLTDGLSRAALRLGLASGGALPEPVPGDTAGRVPGPTWIPGEQLALGFRAPRSWTTHLARAVLEYCAADVLAPVALDIAVHTVALTRTELFSWFVVRPVPGREQECTDGLVGALGRLADGVPSDVLARAQALFAEGEHLPPQVVADEVALELLLGGELGDSGPPARAAEVGAADVDAVLRAVAAAPVVVGPVPPAGRRWRHPRASVPSSVRGRAYAAVTEPGRRVVVGDEGFVLDTVRDRGFGAAWCDVELLLVSRDGLGALVVLADGEARSLTAAQWRGPRRAPDLVSAFVQRVGPDRVRYRADDRVRATGPGGYPLDAAGPARVRTRRCVAVAAAVVALVSALASLSASSAGGLAVAAGCTFLAVGSVVSARRTRLRGGRDLSARRRVPPAPGRRRGDGPRT